MEYPKINSLYKRAGMYWNDQNKKMQYDRTLKKHELIIGDYADEEFELIKHWQVFEKVDGTNIRIKYEKVGPAQTVRFDGRTKDAQIPTHLFAYLQDTFTVEKFSKAFPEAGRVILYGEGYGPKIQDGGNYRADPSFILFDALVEGHWWLKYEDRLDICQKLSIDHVPLLLERGTEEMIVNLVKAKPYSRISQNPDYVMEGVVCVTNPILRLRNGLPLKFKLKCKDFE